MKLSAPIKRKKLEIKPVKLSYYSHGPENKGNFPIKPIPRRLRSAVKIVAGFILVGTLIPLAYYFVNKYKFLEVTEVIVYGGNTYVSTDEVKNHAESKLLGKPILTLNIREYANSVKNSFKAIEKTELKTKLPNKVIITIIERSPVAILDSENNKYLVDKEGYVMQQLAEDSKEFPIIDYADKVALGQFINRNIVPISTELASHAKGSNLVINKMKFTNQYITLNINDNIEVDLSLEKDNASAMKQVAAIIQKTSSEGQKIRKVDLRFEKVIVLYD